MTDQNDTKVTDLKDLKTAVNETAQDNIAVASTDAQPVYKQKIDKQGRAYATGKRKSAVARVWIKPGSGKITVNGRTYNIFI